MMMKWQNIAVKVHMTADFGFKLIFFFFLILKILLFYAVHFRAMPL